MPMPDLGAKEMLNGHSINGLLCEREKTHGDFRDNAAIAQALKDVMRRGQWDDLNVVQREALDFIASKIGPILAGDAGFEDHWADISGYALLPIRS
jgi:hypothetical protein